MATQPSSSIPAATTLELEESDIQGAYLPDPLDAHTVEQLKWWLSCHGCTYLASDRKKVLIEK